MADSMASPGDPAGLHVIRCAECHALVPADRVRHREESVHAGSPAPGRWRAGGPPIFRVHTQSPRFMDTSGAEMQYAPAPRNDPAIERIPVCVDCLRRQRMGLYGICGIAAACCAVAVALYRGEVAPTHDQPAALATSTDSPSLTSHATATPTPVSPAIAPAAPEPAKNETGDSSPIWRPILDAAASLFATASVGSPTTPEPTPTPQAISEMAPPPAAAASAPPTATRMGPIATAEPTPSEGTAAVPDSNPAGAASNTDVAEAGPAAPPIWTTERKPPRKPAKATPPVRRDAPAAANVVAMRNDGYAALQERRYREALILLQHATMMGDPYAPMYIGQIFEKGIGVARDVGQASYWYGIAIDRGNGAALAAFNRMRVNPY